MSKEQLFPVPSPKELAEELFHRITERVRIQNEERAAQEQLDAINRAIANKEKKSIYMKQYMKEYCAKNRPALTAQQKLWRERNAELNRTYQREYHRKRRAAIKAEKLANPVPSDPIQPDVQGKE